MGTCAQPGLAEQRWPLAIPVVLRTRLWAHTQTWDVCEGGGFFPSSWRCGVLLKCSYIIKYLPDLLQTWSLPCVTLQDTDDRARPWSQLERWGPPWRLMALSCVICVGWAVPECTAEPRLSNRNRLTGAWFSSQGFLLQQSLPLPWWSNQERQLSSVSCPLQSVGELCSKAWWPAGRQPSKQARNRDRPRVRVEEKQGRAKPDWGNGSRSKKIKGNWLQQVLIWSIINSLPKLNVSHERNIYTPALLQWEGIVCIGNNNWPQSLWSVVCFCTRSQPAPLAMGH